MPDLRALSGNDFASNVIAGAFVGGLRESEAVELRRRLGERDRLLAAVEDHVRYAPSSSSVSELVALLVECKEGK